LLAAFEVEGLEANERLLSEVGDALVEMVVLGKLGALGDKRVAFAFDAAGAPVELAGPPCHVGVVDYPGLVEVGEAAALGGCLFDPAVEAVELGGEQLVVGDRCGGDHGSFAGSEQLGASQQLDDLVEHEGVELVGSDAALGTAAVLPAGADGVVVRAQVVAGEPG
jgi:hypothetical protein